MSNTKSKGVNPTEPNNNSALTDGDDKLAKYRGDLQAAEKSAARDVNYQPFLAPMAIGLFGVLIAIVLPHSGEVHGYDVLFNSPVAQEFNTKLPERAYSWLALTGGILLPIGTIVSRSWLVAWVNWFFAGIAWWYSAFAIWIRQSRPVTDPGEAGLWPDNRGCMPDDSFATLSVLLFRKTLCKGLAQARREEAHRDEASALNSNACVPDWKSANRSTILWMIAGQWQQNVAVFDALKENRQGVNPDGE